MHPTLLAALAEERHQDLTRERRLRHPNRTLERSTKRPGHTPVQRTGQLVGTVLVSAGTRLVQRSGGGLGLVK
jgi:hypothetical protein